VYADSIVKQWDKALRDKTNTPILPQITTDRVKKYGNAFMGAYYWRFTGGPVKNIADIDPMLLNLVPAKRLELPLVTLPAVGPLKSKTDDLFLVTKPEFWDLTGMGPKTKQFISLFTRSGPNKAPTGFEWYTAPGSNKWQGPYMFAAVADWIAANMMDAFKAIAYIAIFTAKNASPYRSWAGLFQYQRI
jgi:hypothetical protein